MLNVRVVYCGIVECFKKIEYYGKGTIDCGD